MAEIEKILAIQSNTYASASDRESNRGIITGVEQGVEIEEQNDGLKILEHDDEISNEECNVESEDISGSLLGMTRQTTEEMYKLYCQHARARGFSVRKGTTRYSTANIELARYFYCSSKGLKKESTTSNQKRVGITRTDFKAKLSIKLNKDGVYEVVLHEMTHNHSLTRAEWSHYHRSERRITAAKGEVIKNMILSGMKTTESYRYMAHDAGGEENVGHTLKDHKNFLNRKKMQTIEGGDALTFVKMMDTEKTQDPDFYYSVKVDEESKLCNIFWRDSIMKEDYSIYGDVVVFYTTYRTNKYSLICGPFVGVNNHWKNVMFGCTFISNEKTETFEWVFNEFRKSMEDKYPITIFTDQDLAMANGIKKV